MSAELSFSDKVFVLSSSESKLRLWVRFSWSASKVAHWWQIRLLWTCVKLSLRVRSVISHLGITTYKYAAPGVICVWLLYDDFLRERLLWESQERYWIKTKSLPSKHKSYWSELVHYDLGGSLLSFFFILEHYKPPRRLESHLQRVKINCWLEVQVCQRFRRFPW